jgi:hypothetical protein
MESEAGGSAKKQRATSKANPALESSCPDMFFNYLKEIMMNIKNLFTDVQQHSLQDSDRSSGGQDNEELTSPHAARLRKKRLPQQTSRTMIRRMLMLTKPLKKFKKP